MSLATYGDLKASLVTWATRSDLTAQLPDFVTWAHEEICRRLRANVNTVRTTVSVAGEFAAVPADFVAIRSFILPVTPRVTLGVVAAAVIEDIIAGQSSGSYPSVVAVEGAQFHFGPLFSATTTANLLYYARPATLVADIDTNTVLTKYPYLYLYGGLEALFLYLEDDNNADRYGAKFGALIASINDEEAKDAVRGPLSPQPSGIVV